MQSESNKKHNKKKEFVDIVHLYTKDPQRSACNRFITWSMNKTNDRDIATCEVCLKSIGRVFIMPSIPSTLELADPLKKRISLRIRQLEEQIDMLNTMLLKNKEILESLQ